MAKPKTINEALNEPLFDREKEPKKKDQKDTKELSPFQKIKKWLASKK